MDLDVAYAPSASTTFWQRGRITWEQVCAWPLSPRTDGSKDGPGYVLGKLSSNRRTKDTVVSRGVVALDADHLEPATMAGLLRRLEELQCAAMVYTTFSSTKAAPRLRILVLPSRPLVPDEYWAAAHGLMHQLGWGCFDHSSAQPERLMYMPSVAPGGEFFYRVYQGQPLDAEGLLAGADLVYDVPERNPEPDVYDLPARVVPTQAVPQEVIEAQVQSAVRGLDALCGLAEGQRMPWPGYVDGIGWDIGTLFLAERLIEAANSGGSYTIELAQMDFMEHAPASSGSYKQEHKWRQALKWVGSKPIPYFPAEQATEVFDPVTGAVVTDAQEKARIRFPALDWYALWADDQEEEWIHEPLLPARRSVAIYSAPKVGKSLILLELAVTVSMGREFLATTPSRRYRVLYVDFENDPKGDVKTRLIDMGYGPADLDHLDYLSFPAMAGLDTAQGAAELLEAVAAYGTEVVVVDTVSRAVAGEENSNDTWLAMYRHTGLALKQAGVAIIRLDHSGKDEEKGTRGGSAKSGDVDAIWRLSKLSDDRLLLECTESRMMVPTKAISIHRQLEPLHHVVSTAPILPGDDGGFRPTEIMERVCAALAEHGPLSMRMLRTAVGAKLDTVTRARDLLALEGYISEKSPHALIKTFVAFPDDDEGRDY